MRHWLVWILREKCVKVNVLRGGCCVLLWPRRLALSSPHITACKSLDIMHFTAHYLSICNWQPSSAFKVCHTPACWHLKNYADGKMNVHGEWWMEGSEWFACVCHALNSWSNVNRFLHFCNISKVEIWVFLLTVNGWCFVYFVLFILGLLCLFCYIQEW